MSRHYDAGDCYEPPRLVPCYDARGAERCHIPSVCDPQMRCAGDVEVGAAFERLWATIKARPLCPASPPPPRCPACPSRSAEPCPRCATPRP